MSKRQLGSILIFIFWTKAIAAVTVGFDQNTINAYTIARGLSTVIDQNQVSPARCQVAARPVRICEIIPAYRLGTTLRFNNQLNPAEPDPVHPCQPTRDRLAAQNLELVPNSAPGQSRPERERPSLTEIEQRSLVSRARDLVLGEKVRCCQGDTRCDAAMDQLSGNIRFCDIHSSKDMSTYASCDAGRAWYDLSSLRMQNQLLANSSPIAGQIILSPFLSYSGRRQIDDNTIRHEVAHACMAIQRQVTAIYSSSTLARQQAAQSVYQVHGSPQLHCNLNEPERTVYVNSTQWIDSNPQLSNCLYQLASQSAVPHSLVYETDACPRRRLEESYAMAYELLNRYGQSDQSIPSDAIENICYEGWDNLHPQYGDVLKCLLTTSEVINTNFNAISNCWAGPLQ